MSDNDSMISSGAVPSDDAQPKRKRHEGQFKKGDPRINRKGRPPLSEQQREFRRKLHDMEPSLLEAIQAKLMASSPKKVKVKADSSVVNKLIDKLAGPDTVNVKMQVEKEVGEFLATAKAALSPEEYEKLATAFLAKGGAE